MTSESTHFFACRQIPYLDCLIIACTDESSSIGAKRHIFNKACMTDEGTYFSACGQVPYLDRLILASTEKSLSIGANCYAVNSLRMTSEDTKHCQFFDCQWWRYQLLDH